MKNFYFLLSLIIIISCKNENSDEREKSQYSIKEIKPFFKDEVNYKNEIEKIDSDSKLIEVTSLEYINDNGESYVVKSLVSTKKDLNDLTIKKLIIKHTFTNGNETICSFYYMGNRKFASISEESKIRRNDFQKFITQSYYSDENKVFFTKKAILVDGNINELNFKKSKLINHDDKLALKIINQEEEFETRFQGFTENMGKNYLIIGTDKFKSTVAFIEYNSILTLLKKNHIKFENRKLIVEFSVKTEANGFSFQALSDVRLVE
jgi:hypothetical protein